MTTRIVGYHGSRWPVELRGAYWLSVDRWYAEAYGPHVTEVEVVGRVLDLRHLGIDTTSAVLREALQDAGVEPPKWLGNDVDWDEDIPGDEMHQRVPLFERAAREAGYDAICIREWTEGVGQTDSIRVLAEDDA